MVLFARLIAVTAVIAALGSGFANAAKGGTASPMKPILDEYLTIQQALAGDTIKGVATAAGKIAQAATEPGVESAGAILKAARQLTQARELKTARAAFKQLSEPVVKWAKKAKPPGVETVYCSMAPGSWVQKTGEISNPYYGAEMLTCGERE